MLFHRYDPGMLVNVEVRFGLPGAALEVSCRMVVASMVSFEADMVKSELKVADRWLGTLQY